MTEGGGPVCPPWCHPCPLRGMGQTWLWRKSLTLLYSGSWLFLRMIWHQRSRSSAFWALEIFGYMALSLSTLPVRESDHLCSPKSSWSWAPWHPRAG